VFVYVITGSSYVSCIHDAVDVFELGYKDVLLLLETDVVCIVLVTALS
jgi:hypothetical protein